MTLESNAQQLPDVRSLSVVRTSWYYPIFQLPYELLTRIVSDALPSPLDQPYADFRIKPLWRSNARAAKALLPVSHTCRRLRQVVLSDPLLWRHITSTNRHFNHLLLSRSGPSSPLVMVVPSTFFGFPPHAPLSEFHRQLAPRLQELHVLDRMDDCIPRLARFLEVPFSHLEYFSLTSSDSMMSRENHQSHSSSLPLSGINAPRLRYLSLGLTTSLPPESGFPRLTHLSLSFITAPNLHSRVATLLGNCPALTSLVLRKLQCSTRIDALDFWRPMDTPVPLPLDASSLCRVILADMDPNVVEYYAVLFSYLRPCIQIPISKRDPFASREREVFGSLYSQCVCGTYDTDISRLSIATHAVDHDVFGTASGFSVTLANTTNLLRVSVWPNLLEPDPYGRRNWREDILAPLCSLPDVREVWFTDVDMIAAPRGKQSDGDANASVSLWSFSDLVDGSGLQGEPAARLPALTSAVIVHDCSSRLRLGGAIQPSIGVLPKRRAGGGSTPTLEHLRLAIGYDPDDLHRLRDVWSRSGPAARTEVELHPQGKVNLSAKLLCELASAEYAYVKQARAIVQLMPHLALDADELEQLRGHFAAQGVVVEEIDRLPQMPVPDRVRDDVFSPEGFIPGSVLS